MKKLIWTATIAAGLLGAGAAAACDEHQSAQQEQKPQKKVAKKATKKAVAPKTPAAEQKS